MMRCGRCLACMFAKDVARNGWKDLTHFVEVCEVRKRSQARLDSSR